MAFLLRDQNQGTRNNGADANPRQAPQPFSFIRTSTVGFGIAPNLLTHFPTRHFGEEGARGLGLSALTAGGDFHPALRTSAARYEQHFGELCRVARARASRFGMGNRHAPIPQSEARAAAGAGCKR